MNLEPHFAHVSFKKGGQSQSQGNTQGGYQKGGNSQYQQSNRGNYNNRGHGRGRGRGGRGQFCPICQISNKAGHLASHYYFRFDHNFTVSNNANSSQQRGNNNGNASAYVASPHTVDDSS